MVICTFTNGDEKTTEISATSLSVSVNLKTEVLTCINKDTNETHYFYLRPASQYLPKENRFAFLKTWQFWKENYQTFLCLALITLFIISIAKG